MKILFGLLIGINLFFASWYVLHNDILFQTDIARDFLLLDEIDDKKLILIGPRSSTSGLFHGPLWLYLNYPAYLIGQGNPLVVGWFWILLIVAFLATSFIIAKKLFNETTAYLYTLLLSLKLIFEARGLFNPHGALFLLPAFFFFFLQYIKHFKIRDLVLLVLLGGLMIQFQMAIGIPMTILAALPIIFLAIKKRHTTHLLSFFLLPIILSSFILFELRHNFSMFHTGMKYAFGDNLATNTYTNYAALFVDRLKLMSQDGFGVLMRGDIFLMTVVLVITLVFISFQIRHNNYKHIYLWALYFYVGYYILTLINKSGGMLYHYYMPLWGLTLLIFASLVTSRYKFLFFGIFITIYIWNSTMITFYLQTAKTFIGKSQNSWQSLHHMAQKVYSGNEKEFGYFLYAPDTLGYQQKYAMKYESKRTNKKGFYFEKKLLLILC